MLIKINIFNQTPGEECYAFVVLVLLSAGSLFDSQHLKMEKCFYFIISETLVHCRNPAHGTGYCFLLWMYYIPANLQYILYPKQKRIFEKRRIGPLMVMGFSDPLLELF